MMVVTRLKCNWYSSYLDLILLISHRRVCTTDRLSLILLEKDRVLKHKY